MRNLFISMSICFFYKFDVYERALTPKILSHFDELLLVERRYLYE